MSDTYIDRIMKVMKQNYESYWRNSLGDKKSDEGRLYIYRHVKSCFMFEPYLKQVSSFKIRRAVTKMRISSNNLEIETGRYANKANDEEFIDRDKRFCTLCKEKGLKLVGDEFHAAIFCQNFDIQRSKLFETIEKEVPNFNGLSDRNKLYYMLSCEGDLMNKIGKFFNYIFSYDRPKLRVGKPKKKTGTLKKRRKK